MRRAAHSFGIAASFLIAAFASAQDAEVITPPTVSEELRALRQVVEQQSRQIEALTQQVTQLNGHYDAPPKAMPVSTPAAETTLAPGIVADPPRTDAAGAGPKHPVAKGETLTSIAKRYNIPVAELQKANGIKDDRKLQIGQILSIPAPGGKPSEPSNEKKENP